jgi:membrane protein YdbS with pleckstrin-like domain
VRTFRASPRFLAYRLVGVALFVAGLCVAWILAGVSIAASGEPLALLLLLPLAVVVAAAAALAYVGVRIDYDMRHYVVTDRSIRIREGAFVIREKTLTHANVQNLRLVQGPLQRAFGIQSLAVHTAGGGAGTASAEMAGSAHRFDLAGIENAAEIRDLVLAHLRALGGATAGLGDPDDEPRTGAAPRLGADALAALRDVRAAAADLRAAAEARGGRGIPTES